jgi:nicotinate-nucleotide adenylyltransferase
MNLAIFGGTFDPIHCAHLTVAREAADAFKLDRVLFVPAANPPHKSGTLTSYEDRFRMVELACAVDSRFIASRLEEGIGKSYSILTIERVRATLAPEDKLYFIIGADAFAEVTSWYRWGDVIRLVEFLVVTRPGHEYSIPQGARSWPLDTLALPVSSSDIRSELADGKHPLELPAPVFQYIGAHRLYDTKYSV